MLKDLDNRKSNSNYIFLISLGIVSWYSKKKITVTISTTEVESLLQLPMFINLFEYRGFRIILITLKMAT